ncbi:uncharacterized protein LOC8023850 isoform X3 [Ixodes scapularis]|uniref:uncharacterized protein LOC8023850 isoform X3 n=1 Tax=Ixodes scapularis TaxID=6945 RepID=UPI001C391342|nr:uncharacterized protein LOC8023850 isoform X3 [Ixodes scapularis]
MYSEEAWEQSILMGLPHLRTSGVPELEFPEPDAAEPVFEPDPCQRISPKPAFHTGFAPELAFYQKTASEPAVPEGVFFRPDPHQRVVPGPDFGQQTVPELVSCQEIAPEPAASEPVVSESAVHGSGTDKPGKPVASRVAWGYKRWPKVYWLPQFSPGLHKALLMEDASFYTSGRTRLKTLLINAIARDLAKYKLLPSPSQYCQVFKALRERFPFLREKRRWFGISKAVKHKVKKERLLLVSTSGKAQGSESGSRARQILNAGIGGPKGKSDKKTEKESRRQVEPGVPEPEFPEPDAAEPVFERDLSQRTSPEPALHRGFSPKPVSCPGIAPESGVSKPAVHRSDMDKLGKPVAPGVAGRSKGWPKVYSLPQFSPELHNALLREDPSFYKRGRTTLKTQIIDAIVRDISKYDGGLGLPSPSQYCQVFKALRECFPFLREKLRWFGISKAVKHKVKKERLLLVSTSGKAQGSESGSRARQILSAGIGGPKGKSDKKAEKESRRQVEPGVPEPEFPEPDAAEPVFEQDPFQRTSPEPALHRGLSPKPVSCPGIAPEPAVSKPAVHGSDMDKLGKPVAPGVAGSSKRWPKVYSLPQFSPELHNALLSGDASFYKRGRTRLKTQIIDAIVPNPNPIQPGFKRAERAFPLPPEATALQQDHDLSPVQVGEGEAPADFQLQKDAHWQTTEPEFPEPDAAEPVLERDPCQRISPEPALHRGFSPKPVSCQGDAPEPAVSEPAVSKPAVHGSDMDKPGKSVAPGIAGKVYSLPQFSPGLQKALLNEDASFYTPGRTTLKTLLINAIAKDISKKNMGLGYPTQTQYSQVSNALEERFPFLREKGRCGRIVFAVQCKLEKKRQLLVSNSKEVPDGRRQKWTTTVFQTSAELGQPGDEALTDSCFADALREAMSEQPVDLPLVKCLMRRTLRVRQELIKRVSVASVLQDYPALKLPGMMLQDAKLHFGIDIFEAIRDKMPLFQARALLFLEEKKVVLDFEHLIKDDPEKVSLLNLPVAFDERRAFFFTTDEEVTARTPIIQVKESCFSIFVDGVEAVCDIETTAEAVGTLMAAYHLFNIEYPADLARTMEFIEHFFCDLGGGNVTEPVERLACFLKE